MATKKKVTSARELIKSRHKDDLEYDKMVKEARTELNIAEKIYHSRKQAGLTQKELADLIGTTPSVISRLEDADYDGQSLKMLRKIADALNLQLRVELI